MIYAIFIGISIFLFFGVIKIFYQSTDIKKEPKEYFLLATTPKYPHYIGLLISIFILSILIANFSFTMPMISFVIFFIAIALTNFSFIFYINKLQQKLNNYEEFFKELGIDINNMCHKKLLEKILLKTQDKEEVKRLFNKNKCS